MKISKIEQLGISGKEARIFLTLLEHGKLNLAKLSERTKIKRTTLYPYLESLLERGFVARTIVGKRTYYVAENPKKLRTYFSQQLSSYESLLPTFLSLYANANSKPDITMYEGKEEIRKLFREISETANYTRTFFSPGRFVETLGNAEADRYIKTIYTKRGIKPRGLCADNPAGKKFMQSKFVLQMDVRMMPRGINFPLEIMIFNRKVSFISFNNLFAVVIESDDIKDFHHQIFDVMWELAK